ncbi:MAG: EAL domain-containing protein [Candidatus Devosia phytovorans]|uniref:EAL domain-containing protein n=1 Tax=Candidatus Devosia phytovorans TaxID=3121372 RepID=A0AAJ6B0D3_9HYPH|nr:EAL domain-containing protein [Devosia sp.]WEK05585.1 MAG: EAL domain-containing protein [Devosia sp.]
MQHTTTGQKAGADTLPIALSPQVTESIDRVLTAIRSHLRMDVAFITEFLGSSRIFRSVDFTSPAGDVEAGNVVPIASGYCQHVTAGRLPELIADTSTVPLAQTIPETRQLPIGAHLSVPIRVDHGKIFGTFCCFSHRPMPELGQPELDLMHTFGRMIALELTKDIERDAEQRRKITQVHNAMWSGDPDIVFQPVLRLEDRKIIAVEALSRFAAPPRQTPDRWFADAADVGMGGMLEMLALRRAVALCRDLPRGVSVNLNVSPNTLLTENILHVLHGFDPRRVVVEITEHEPVHDYEPLLLALKPLREAGIRVAIDDAGAGYSSLRHVLMLRPEIVKLDVSLTRGVDHDPMRQAMAAALGEFARRTGTIVVAEGVETTAELEALMDVGIPEIQGYILSKPQPMADLLKMLKPN